jgi:hypothetical protein
MKKFTLLQTSLVAILTLIIGLLIGISINSFTPSGDEIAGSIGKVDRYRNVRVTENDILLRNELIEDTAKRAQFEKYLLYYYYKSMKTSVDVDQVLAKTKGVSEFSKYYYPYADALGSFEVYLESARADMLIAINLLMTLDENDDFPVINYLNQAQNAVARIRNHDAILMNYMDAIESFVNVHPELPETELQQLKDAHDILALNAIQTAVIAQNKPVLKYLDNKKLLNNKEGIKGLVAEANYNSIMQNQINMDVESIKSVALDSENTIGSIVDFNSETVIGSLHNSIEVLNSILLSQQLSVLEISSQETINNFVINSESLLSLSLNSEQLGGMIELLNAMDALNVRLNSDILSGESVIGSEMNQSGSPVN